MVDRCEAISGDFFVSVPAGANAYLLSRVIHDWDDEKAIAILKVVRGAIAPHGRLVLLETMLRPTASTVYPVLSDLNMLLLTGGCERIEAEYRALYRAAGFELNDRTEKSAVPGWGILDHHEHSSTPLAAKADALKQTQEDQQNRCCLSGCM